MGFFTKIKASKAMALHNKGDMEGARKLYEADPSQGYEEIKVSLRAALDQAMEGEA